MKGSSGLTNDLNVVCKENGIWDFGTLRCACKYLNIGTDRYIEKLSYSESKNPPKPSHLSTPYILASLAKQYYVCPGRGIRMTNRANKPPPPFSSPCPR